jgi:hypothetical protein
LYNTSGRKKYLVHRLVAETYLENPKGFEFVNHKDGNKQNNSVDNLEWVTRSENMLHAHQTGLIEKRRLLTDMEELSAVSSFLSGESITEIARLKNVATSTMSKILKKHIPPEEFKEAVLARKVTAAKTRGESLAFRVVRIEPTTGVVTIFQSLMDAAESSGTSSGNISNVIHGRSKTAGGYEWELA